MSLPPLHLTLVPPFVDLELIPTRWAWVWFTIFCLPDFNVQTDDKHYELHWTYRR